jgi:hypothetical protein
MASGRINLSRKRVLAANTEVVSIIAIEMAIRVRVRFLKVYTSFLFLG